LNDPGSKVQTKKDVNVYQNFKVVNDAVLAGIAKLLSDRKPTLEEKDLGSSKIAASLSLGLCCKDLSTRDIERMSADQNYSQVYFGIFHCLSNRYQPGFEVRWDGTPQATDIGSYSVTGLIIGLHPNHELHLFCSKGCKFVFKFFFALCCHQFFFCSIPTKVYLYF